MEFNLADLFEDIADAIPDRDALYTEGRTLTYRQLDQRANRLAHHFTAAGVRAGDHVGCHMTNGAEYLETMIALLKIRAVPINVNFRYVRDELRYLYDNADLVGLVYDTEFADRVAAVLPDVPRLRHLLAVGSGDGLPGGALRYEDALRTQPDDRAGFPERSADDLMIIYTGGTTGMPKGVVWRHEDLLFGGMSGGSEPLAKPEDAGPRAAATAPLVMFAAPPLMHGTAVLAAFIAFLAGGKVCLIRKYSGEGAVRIIQEQGCQTMMIVGDAMAMPIIEALDAAPQALPSLQIIASAGALLTQPVRDRLQAHLPNLFIVDSFGSTETGHSGAGVTSGRHFTVNDSTTVLDDTFKPVAPGSGVVGQVARRGHIAQGYYGDPDKTARTFVEVDGVRWVLSGDLATVDADGSVHFLGRSSICINSGGEKIYPEEVEAALKTHPAITDAVVAGIPDARWGQKVAAVLQFHPTAAAPSPQDLETHLAPLVARYKLPRFTHVVPRIQRSPSGKPDYRWATETLTQAAGLDQP
ncbi:acyl-CoA synthetase (AMP-forming)/AMP-acid ligase II [Kibdelosporangium banguiense]|uniref:Acyl-CoA synthetase (AMP-forming)/AMP-acid ligase II n=1 Tax=Kibdelosporangium banguiense TaxID=1365924 RepID=A0ABS4TTQ0_9PSEU|nr:acyl-CoA synthetase [Kibdelosporangium banguiense]MBP2327787.1 acyl-CoA synthetase (AMP-forming)/AMP-acid ligase II [Kibdelosporangium banguiense]